MRTTFFRALAGATLGLSIVAVSGAADAKEAKYVFMMIGDGMAMAQRNAAEIFLASRDGGEVKPGIVKLTMSAFPAQGMQTTYSTNSIITDSAAAATALSTGFKTQSGVIGMDATGKKPFKLISEMAKEKGYKIGIVTSVSLNHATPAGYYAHVPSRHDYYGIGLQMADSGFEYFGGGGVNRATGKKKDKKSVYDVLTEKGYTVAKTRGAFDALKPGAKAVAVNPYLDGSSAMPYAIDRPGDSISLADFTKKGVELLDGPDGFFLMVEGGKIDWSCHANDAVTSIKDTVAFDDAVKVAYDFYQKHPDETLIVTTGDHETGGLTIGFAGTKYDTFFPQLAKQNASYDEFDKSLADYKKNHTADTASLDDLAPQVKERFGLDVADLKEHEVSDLNKALKQSMLDKKVQSANPQDYLLYGGYEPFTVALTHLLNRKAGLSWTTYSHTGVPVPVMAIGVGAEKFNGYYDNTDVAKKMMNIMGLGGAA